jgi:hypothetical protein
MFMARFYLSAGQDSIAATEGRRISAMAAGSVRERVDQRDITARKIAEVSRGEGEPMHQCTDAQAAIMMFSGVAPKSRR